MVRGAPRGFRRARARAGAGPLLALGVVAAIAALLVAGLFGAIRAGEAAGVRASLGESDAASAVVHFDTATGAEDERRAAIDEALRTLGAPGALRIDDAGDGTFALTPDAAHFSGDAVIALAGEWNGLGRGISAVAGERATVTGGLGAALAPHVRGIENRRGPAAVALAIALLLAAVVVAAAAVEPVRTRREETALLRARGLSRRSLTGLAVAEAIPVILLGALAGAVLAWVAVFALTGMPLPWFVPALAAGVPAVAGTLTVTVTAWREAGRRSSRGDLFAGIAAVIVLAVVAGLAAWQFHQAGTPVITRSGGGRAVDPLIAAAPALVLALFALIAVVIAGPVAGTVAAASRRTRGVFPVLPLRLASRRMGRHALTTGAVAFASATLTLATVLSATLAGVGAVPEEIRVGSDVRVISVRDGAAAAQIGALPGAEAAMRARALSVRGADSRVSLLAVEAGQAGAVLHDAGGLLDPAALGDALAVGEFGVAVADAASDLTVSVRLTPGVQAIREDGSMYSDWFSPLPELNVRLLLRDAAGRTAELVTSNLITTEQPASPEAELVQGDRQDAWAATLPLPAAGPWRVIGVDAWQGVERSYMEVNARVEVVAAGEVLDLGSFTGGVETGESDAATTLFTMPQGWQGGDAEVARVRAADAPTRFPAVMTEELAAAMNASPGSTLSLRLSSFPVTIDAEVVALVPLLPAVAGGSGIAVDVAALVLGGDDLVPPNEVWLRSGDPPALAAAVAEGFEGVVVDTADPRAAQSAFGAAVAFLLTAAGAVVLALIVLVLRRGRTDGAGRELAILAVLGLGRRGAARVRAIEAAVAIAIGVLSGAAAGLVVAHLAVPSLVRGSYAQLADAFPIDVSVPVIALALTIVAALVLFCAVAASVRAPRHLADALRETE